MEGAAVVAVTDSVSQKGKAFADEIGVTFYEDIDTLLDAAQVDVVAPPPFPPIWLFLQRTLL